MIGVEFTRLNTAPISVIGEVPLSVTLSVKFIPDIVVAYESLTTVGGGVGVGPGSGLGAIAGKLIGLIYVIVGNP
jgi:hypothetical protein